MIAKRQLDPGMKTFIVIWFGQLISILGSSLTSFALGIWTYQQTGSVSQFAIVLFASTLPPVLLAPFAGLLADYWNRRWLIILADTGSALSTLVVVVLLLTNHLEAWHIYLTAGFSAIMGTIQGPAYIVTIPLLVPPDQLGRANGMGQFSRSLGQLIAPILGGFLLVSIGLPGIITIDLLTFLVAVTTMLIVRFPDRPRATQHAARESRTQAITAGWRYIIQRPGLLALLIYFALINFFLGSIEVLVTPLALSVTSADMLGVILFTGGLGMVAGSLTMSFWGGPRRKIYGILVAQLIGGLCVLLAGLNTHVLVFVAVAFIYFFGVPIGDGCSTMILQQKVATYVQGRVFALVGAITSFVLPISYLIVSTLVDRVFEPLMMPDGALAGTMGPLIGVGEGRGIALMFATMGLLAMVVTLLAYLYPPLRLIEDQLPTMNLGPVPTDAPVRPPIAGEATSGQ